MWIQGYPYYVHSGDTMFSLYTILPKQYFLFSEMELPFYILRAWSYIATGITSVMSQSLWQSNVFTLACLLLNKAIVHWAARYRYMSTFFLLSTPMYVVCNLYLFNDKWVAKHFILNTYKYWYEVSLFPYLCRN